MGTPEAKLPGGQIMRWKQQDYPSYYANVMGFGMSPFDINLVFGEIGDSTATEVIGIPKARIHLSPEQADNLIKLLGIALAAYVKNNGPLRTAGSVNVEALSLQLEEQATKTLQ